MVATGVVATELNRDSGAGCVCRQDQQGLVMDCMWLGEGESRVSVGSRPELLHSSRRLC